jgi:hypothetical protein
MSFHYKEQNTTVLVYVFIVNLGIYNPTREICGRRMTVYV